MMGNVIIESRIAKLEKVRSNLLNLKKADRKDLVKDVNEKIARLKSWNKELGTKKP